MLTDMDVNRIITKYLNGESIRVISRSENVSKSTVWRILKQNNIDMKSVGNSYNIRKFSFNQEYFDNIDCDKKAYWLGLISADGHVSNDGVTITLQAKDKKLLDDFFYDIELNKQLKYNNSTNSFSAILYSKYIVHTLNNYGFYHDKSKSQTFPIINENLYSHFIRGLLDGDGSIQIKHRMKKGYKKESVEYSVDFSGTYNMIVELKNIIMSQCNASDVKIYTQNSFAVIRWSGNQQVKRILNWVYKDANRCLERKYNKYLEMIGE